MENRIEVKQLGDELIRIAKKELEAGDDVTPVMAFFTMGRKPRVVPIPHYMMDNERSKDMLAFIMKQGARAYNADFFFFLTDTWIAHTEVTDEKSKEDFLERRKAFGSVEHMPEKEDALMLCIESKTTQSITTIRYKKDGSKVEYKPEMVMEGKDSGQSGRFSNIIYSPDTKS